MRAFRVFLPALAGMLMLGARPALSDEPSAWDQAKSFAHSQKDEAVAEAKKAIAAIEQKMSEVTREAKQSGAEAKAAHQRNMKDLATKKKQAEQSLAKLQAASSNAWDATKEGFGKAYQDLKQAYQKAADSAQK